MLVCDNPANSKEHVWPKWILGRVKNGTPLRQTLGSGPAITVGGEFKIKCVCKICNSGWMSDLEIKLKPLLASLSGDLSVQLNDEQQIDLGIWTIKTAIVIEATRPKAERRFFTPKMIGSFRADFTLPPGVRIWVGRYTELGLFAAASQIQYSFDPPQAPGYASVTTMVVGHLVIQALCLDFPIGPTDRSYEIPNHVGAWNETLIPIVPTTPSLLWPPARSFGDGLGSYPLTELRDRWRVEATA